MIEVNQETGGLGLVGINYTLISSNGTFVIKATPGQFLGIVVTAIGTTETVTVYDNTAASGTLLVPTTATIAAIGLINTGFGTLPINTQIGLTVVYAGTTAGTILVLWK